MNGWFGWRPCWGELDGEALSITLLYWRPRRPTSGCLSHKRNRCLPDCRTRWLADRWPNIDAVAGFVPIASWPESTCHTGDGADQSPVPRRLACQALWHPSLADAILDRMVHPIASSCVANHSAGRRLTRTPWFDPQTIPMEGPALAHGQRHPGRLQSESVADIRPESPADFVGMRSG
jgi:hypothetical protein